MSRSKTADVRTRQPRANKCGLVVAAHTNIIARDLETEASHPEPLTKSRWTNELMAKDFVERNDPKFLKLFGEEKTRKQRFDYVDSVPSASKTNRRKDNNDAATVTLHAIQQRVSKTIAEENRRSFEHGKRENGRQTKASLHDMKPPGRRQRVATAIASTRSIHRGGGIPKAMMPAYVTYCADPW